MEADKQKGTEVEKGKITTIKLSEGTKKRVDHLRIYNRETYEDIINRLLDLLNTIRVNPGHARMKLIKLEKERKRNIK